MLQERYPKEVVLTDGKEVTLRPLEERDQDDLVRFYQELPSKERWFFKEDPCDSSVIRKWIGASRKVNTLCLLSIVGCLFFTKTFTSFITISHSLGSLGWLRSQHSIPLEWLYKRLYPFCFQYRARLYRYVF